MLIDGGTYVMHKWSILVTVKKTGTNPEYQFISDDPTKPAWMWNEKGEFKSSEKNSIKDFDLKPIQC